MIDTHAHLDLATAGEQLDRAREAGVDRVVCVGTTIASGREALALADAYDGVFACVGVHPHKAADADADSVEELRELVAHPRAVALGETGLDFYRDYAPHDAQRTLFQRQLELARELRAPVVVHARAADDEVLATLDGFDGTVVLHCFSSPGMLPAALERGYFISVAGNVTYPKAEELRAAARQVPPDRLLAETDSPYLAPQPVRGRPNEPANVVHTIAELARTRGEAVDELAAQLDENAGRAFGLP